MTIILCMLMVTSVLGLFQLFNIGEFGIIPIEVTLGFALLYAVYHTVWLGRALRVPRRMELIVMSMLLFIFIFSEVGPLLSGDSLQILQGLKTFSHFILLWLGAFVLIVIPTTSKQWITAFRVHFGVSIIVVLFAAYQLPARTFEWPLGWIEITNQSFRKLDREASEMGQIALRFADFYRATSIFSEPSALAGYGVVSLMMMMVPVFRRSQTIIKTRTFLIISIICTTVAIFLSFSMSGMILVVSVLCLSVALYPRTAPKRILGFMLAAVVLLAIADVTVEKNFNISVLTLFGTRVENLVSGQATSEGSDIVGESATQRTNDYYVSAKVFESAPVIGVGAGNFGNAVEAKKRLTLYPSTVYGSVLGEMGILGFSALIGFLILLFTRALIIERHWTKYHRGEDTDLDRLVPLMPFRILIVIVGGFFGSFFVSAIFWLDIIIVMSITSLARREMGKEVDSQIFLVRKAWRNRFIENRQGANL